MGSVLSVEKGRRHKFSHTGFQYPPQDGALIAHSAPMLSLSTGELAFMVSLKVNFYCPQQPISVAKVRFVIYQDVAAQWNNELPQ